MVLHIIQRTKRAKLTLSRVQLRFQIIGERTKRARHSQGQRNRDFAILINLFIYLFIYWRASEASKTLSGVTQSRFRYIWRASVASETLTGVKMKKSGMFVCLYIWTYVCHFVL